MMIQSESALVELEQESTVGSVPATNDEVVSEAAAVDPLTLADSEYLGGDQLWFDPSRS